MGVINGIHSKTIENMQLDAGVLIRKKVAVSGITDFASEIKSHGVGATKGATTFSAVPEIRNIFDGIDGVKGDIKDGNVIDKWTVTLKTSVTELTLDNLKMALGCGISDSSQLEGVYDTLEPSNTIQTSDYKSFTWVGTMAGGSKPIVIVLNNCLNINGLTITAEDKNTGTVEIELKAHIDLANTEKQFKIYLPKDRAVMAASEVDAIAEKFNIEKE